MDATFALSNMCPQVGDGFNRDYWAHLEDFCRRLTRRYPSVRIVTGPLYLPRRGEDGRVGGDVSLGAFVLPNAAISNDKPLGDFEVPIDVVERASGLEFAKELPVQRRKRLCGEVSCSILVKEYAERQKAFQQPPSRT